MRKEKSIQTTRESEDTRVSVTGKGIEINREGKPVSGTTLTGDVYLLVDCSASMEGDKLKQAKKGALNFAKEALAKGYLTGVIRFDSSAKLICEPLREISLLEKRVTKLEIGDTTHMAKGIELAHRLLTEMSGTRVMVIVTDGMPNGPDDPKSTLRAGESAKKNGIDIIAIGTDDADQKFLRRLASRKELGMKVSSRQLEKTITDSAKLLPSGGKQVTKR